MKTIEPDSITELKIMPILIAILIAFGLAAAYSRKRWMLNAWTASFLILSIVGLVDFWLWEYDYGHNLDFEKAIIKIPGLYYQPPLIGSKQLLNFVAHSWPGVGGWTAILSLFTGMWLVFINTRKKRRADAAALRPSSPVSKGRVPAAVASLLLLSACTQGPEPIYYGEDEGASCRMTISDDRFASEILTTTGRAYKFDSIECLLNYANSGNIVPEDIASIWVVDFSQPGVLIPVDDATFVRSPDIRTPMGAGLVAFSSSDAASEFLEEVRGDTYDWNTLSSQTGYSHTSHRKDGSESTAHTTVDLAISDDCCGDDR